MRTLAIDIETYSSVDLKKSGVYRYAEAEDFTILIFGYAWDAGPVQIVDLAQGEELPITVLGALQSPEVIKTAFNANFERTCLARYFNEAMPPEQWQCTAVHALSLGLPMSLADVGRALGLPESKQKNSAGAALIRYFCIPQKRRPAAQNTALQFEGEARQLNPNRNYPWMAPEKWEKFKAYCIQDVEVERTIRNLLGKYPVSQFEHRLWCLDQLINDTGVQVDTTLVKHALKCNAGRQSRLEKEALELTRLDNPKSVQQLKAWMLENEGVEVESLTKDTVPGLLAGTENETVKRVLEIRQELSKTSIKKYEAIARSVCKDRRVRGLFQFYGASRTGRWAGRLVQVQNLPQNKLKDLDLARQILRSGDYDTFELLFDNTAEVLSQLIRTAFIAGKDKEYLVADFSAIEARIIAWLAGEDWRMEVFQTHGKIYEASASQMFKVPIEEITKDNPLRQKGKIAELALGYGGATGALINMGALKQGLVESELPDLVKVWRASNPAITNLWWDVENAAMGSVDDKLPTKLQHGLLFTYDSDMLFITLPSGRRLTYMRPQIELDHKHRKSIITYEGYEQGKWSRLHTYGPKLVENIVQAIARDCLAEAMLRVHAAGYKIVMHVHDEVVLETQKGEGDLDAVCNIMALPLKWAPGLPLPAAGFITPYYKKD